MTSPVPLTPSRAALLLALGAVVGSFLDGFHTHSGTTAYPHPIAFGMAVWTPALFGAAALSMAWTHAAFDRVSGRGHIPSGAAALAGFVLFAVLYFASGYLPATNAVKAAVLLAGFAVAWAAFDRSWQGLALALFTAACGCAAEIALTAGGAFQHLQADVLGIPIWLPGLYLVASVAVGNVGRLVLAPLPLETGLASPR